MTSPATTTSTQHLGIDVGGITRTAANIDPSWQEFEAAEYLAVQTGRTTHWDELPLVKAA